MDSLSRSGRLRRALQQEPTWLLINDFCISPTSKSEVLQLFGSHKLPCLLYYTQASTTRNTSHVVQQIIPRTSIRCPICVGPAGALGQEWSGVGQDMWQGCIGSTGCAGVGDAGGDTAGLPSGARAGAHP